VPAAALPLAEALERLRDPDACEHFSALAGQPWFAVDFGKAFPAAADAATEAARARLAELPCPTLALVEGPLDAALARLVSRFDVVVATPRALERAIAAAAAQPLAAQTLMQLLRLSEGRPTGDALVAESLAYATLQAGPAFARWLAARPPPRPRARPDEPAVRVARVEGELEIALNRPAVRNAFSKEMRDALCEALRLAHCDASVVRVRLLGEGPDFCSGGDLDEFGSAPDPATAHAVRTTRSPGRLLHAIASRCEAVVHGHCVGAGVELPAFAAQVVARPDASFRLPELAMGLVPGAGGTASLPLRIGRQRTAWLALSGEAIDAETAFDWGLVDRIAD
jgi:enoyl-CoA hydratase/carnithine racemase